jgi:hypothetical protein
LKGLPIKPALIAQKDFRNRALPADKRADDSFVMTQTVSPVDFHPKSDPLTPLISI